MNTVVSAIVASAFTFSVHAVTAPATPLAPTSDGITTAPPRTAASKLGRSLEVL